MPKQAVGVALEVAGAGMVVMGIWTWSPALALVVAGGLCIFLAQGIGEER